MAPASAIPYSTKKELIVEDLQAQILSGALPPGAVLRQDELAAAFGVSVTPVREALRELAARGLVTHEPHRGVHVAETSWERHDELADIRVMLESFATRLATPRLTSADIDELERLTARMSRLIQNRDQREIRLLNYRFHMLVYERSESPYLLPMIAMAWGAFHWERLMIIPARLGPAVEEHRAIIAALRAGDADLAAQRMREHILSGASALQQHGESAQAHPTTFAG